MSVISIGGLKGIVISYLNNTILSAALRIGFMSGEEAFSLALTTTPKSFLKWSDNANGFSDVTGIKKILLYFVYIFFILFCYIILFFNFNFVTFILRFILILFF